MSDLIIIKVIEFIIENIYPKKTSSPNGFLGQFFETFKNKSFQIYTNTFRD